MSIDECPFDPPLILRMNHHAAATSGPAPTNATATATLDVPAPSSRAIPQPRQSKYTLAPLAKPLFEHTFRWGGVRVTVRVLRDRLDLSLETHDECDAA